MVVKTRSLPPDARIATTRRASLVQLLSRDMPIPGNACSGSARVVCIGLFTRLFWNNLGHFYYAWTTDENYSHGFLVPLISLYFADQVARGGPVPVTGGQWWADSCSWSPSWCGW